MPRAAALFDRGDALLKTGKIAEACDVFEESNRIEPRAGTLIHLGECRSRNHQLASAWLAYKEALARVKDPKKRAIATDKLGELEPKLSYLTIAVPEGHRVDALTLTRNGRPVEPGTWNHAMPVDGGVYTIAGHAPGRAGWTTKVTVPEASGKIRVEVPVLEPIAGPGPVVTATHPEVAIEPASPPPPDRHDTIEVERWTPRRKLAVVVGGGAAVGLIAGIVLGTQAKSKQHDAFVLCPDATLACAAADQANALVEAGHTRAVAADILSGAAGAAIASGVLWFTGAPEHRAAIVPTITPGAATVTLAGWF